jgi:hypothetical protein
MRLSRLRDGLAHLLIRLRRFFERNVTGFTYLFFAQTLHLAVNIYWRDQLSLPIGETPLHWYPLWLAIFTILFSYALPFLFFLAAFLTFHYPKDKDTRFLFVFITVVLSLFLVAATLLS